MFFIHYIVSILNCEDFFVAFLFMFFCFVSHKHQESAHESRQWCQSTKSFFVSLVACFVMCIVDLFV